MRYKRSDESTEHLKNPRIDDIYFLDMKNGHYSALKIKNLSKESISFFTSKYDCKPENHVDESLASRKLDFIESSWEIDRWTDSIVVFPKDKLRLLYNDELIFEIKRE